MLMMPMTLELIAASAGNAVYAMDRASGNSVSVWQTYNWPDINIQAATKTEVWNPTTTLSNHEVCSACKDPKAAINSDGKAVAIWIGTDPTTSIERIYACTYDSNSWSQPEAISAQDEHIVDATHKVMLSSTGEKEINKINITWKSFMPATGTISVRSRSSGETFGTWSETINTLNP